MMKVYTCSLLGYVLFAEVALCVVPCRVVDERLAEEEFDLMVGPALGRQRLEEHDDALGVICWQHRTTSHGNMRSAPGNPSP